MTDKVEDYPPRRQNKESSGDREQNEDTATFIVCTTCNLHCIYSERARGNWERYKVNGYHDTSGEALPQNDHQKLTMGEDYRDSQVY